MAKGARQRARAYRDTMREPDKIWGLLREGGERRTVGFKLRNLLDTAKRSESPAGFLFKRGLNARRLMHEFGPTIVRVLKARHFTARDVRALNFTVKELATEYSPKELLEGGFHIRELVTQIPEALTKRIREWPITKMDESERDAYVRRLHRLLFGALQLKRLNYNAAKLRRAKVTLADLMHAGYSSPAQVIALGFPKAEVDKFESETQRGKRLRLAIGRIGPKRKTYSVREIKRLRGPSKRLKRT